MPRELTPEELEQLKTLADQAIQQIATEAELQGSLFKTMPEFNPDLRPPTNGHHTQPEPDEEELEQIWDASPRLTNLHQHAQSRLLPPWTVLGATLAIVLATTGPHVILPPIIGAKASLNLLFGLVGPTGGGKTTSVAAAREILNQHHIPVHELGTGQGITSGYTRPPKRDETEPTQYNDTCLWVADEIGSIAAHAGMRGANLLPVLKTAYSGGQLGARYADRERRRTVYAHRYRATFLIGIQPAHADLILQDQEGGFPQRWVWLPTTDPNLPPTPPDPPPPNPWAGSVRLNANGPTDDEQELTPQPEYQIPIYDQARQQIIQARQQRLQGQGDPMASHRLLTRLKLAAAIGLWHDNPRVEPWEWELAGLILDKSDQTRHMCEQAVARQLRKINLGVAKAELEREQYMTEQNTRRVAQAAKRVLLGKAGSDGWVTWQALTRSISSRDRKHLREAMERLISAGEVEHEEIDKDRRGDRYRLITVG